MKMYKIFAALGIFFVGLSYAYALALSDLSFTTVFTGLGTVEINQVANTVELTPMIATAPSETHAGLVVSNETLGNSYEIAMTVKNNAQLRQNSAPNPWEAPWIVFGYNDAVDSLDNPDQTFTYLILKPDGYGLELGESLIDNGQNFLYTSTVGADSYDVGESYDVVIHVENEMITVTIDGVEKFVFSNTAARTLSLNGKFGFYTEDADVEFTNINIQMLSNQGAVGFADGVERSHPRRQPYVKRSYSHIQSDTRYSSLAAEKEKLRKEKWKALATKSPLPNLNDSAIRFRESQKVKRR